MGVKWRKQKKRTGSPRGNAVSHAEEERESNDLSSEGE